MLAGCNSTPTGSARIRGVNLNQISAPAPHDEPIVLSAAKNEWTNFTVQVDSLPRGWGNAKSAHYALRVSSLKLANAGGPAIDARNASAFQILNMPIDVNRAGYVRHTGLSVTNQQLPRALFPLTSQDGRVDLAEARDSAKPTDAKARASSGDQPMLLWIDLHIPPEAKPGLYTATVDVMGGAGDKPIASVPLRLNVYDFVLPDERHLMMVGAVEWDDLARLYTDRFEAVTPRLMNRGDQRYGAAIRTLDQLVALAQANRAQVFIPRLQPTVKWPSGAPPVVSWDDYDSIVNPWLRGEVFPDKQPVGLWPLPAIDNLANYDQRSQRQYWSEAAKHFDQLDWLTRSAVILRSAEGGRARSDEAIKLSDDAAGILDLNPRLRVEVPLEDDQVQFADASSPNLIKPASANRLITANPGLVFNSALRTWPADLPRPSRFLRTDLPGLSYYVGAGGDERDVRLWAWFASIPIPQPPLGVQYGPVQYVRWPRTLPRASKPTEPADPNEMVWFYPGSWFGVDQPVPTVQLKWLRRAQQDFEYLYLARQRGETINALIIARLMSKPVEVQPGQSPDPTFGLMSGTADPQAWVGAINLLAQRILLREPGQPVDEQRDHQLNIDLFRWAEPQERPVAMGRIVSWLPDMGRSGGGPSVSGVGVRLGIDIYNAADVRPGGNTLEFTKAPQGWHYRPAPKPIEDLGTYRVQRFDIDATIEPAELRNTDRTPLEIAFTNGYTFKKTPIRMVLPVGFSDRREGRLSIDGSLEDWMPEDAVQNGPLVRMLNRPALQKQELQLAATSSSLYTGWAEENLYVAFKVTGLSGADTRASRNFVTYSDVGRAWGEDLCEVLVQPVYADSTLGPLLHLVCKPNGSCWVERKMDPRKFVDPWQPIEGAGIRYAPTVDEADWRGELAIPWKALNNDPAKGRPVMLRFNFVQHKTLTGESASWAGPIDTGRDENFTGVLLIREPNTPGMAGS